ncbi:MAG TPA: hypothetical protein VE218_07100 [Acidobacteriaceae bacterium]|nr:hypothetical protein [Acidobacteriaceae bacterium]
MYRIGMVLGPAMFIGAVLEWILRLTHYTELIAKTLPWMEHVISPAGIWVTMAVGILIFVAAWAERKKERDEQRKFAERTSEDVSTHPPSAQPIHTPLPPVAAPTPHNVQFAGLKKIWTDIGRETFVASEGFLGVKACFSNKSIPGTKVSDFDYVKARIVLRDGSGADVVEISRPQWLNRKMDDHVHINVNKTECLLLAVFGNDNEWAAPFIVPQDANYWDDAPKLMIEGVSLPIGELSAEITLVGEDHIGLEPVIAYFSLGAEGSVEIK